MTVLAVVQSEAGESLRRLSAHKGWHLTLADTVASGLAGLPLSGSVIVVLDRDLAPPDWRPSLRQFASQPNCAGVVLASRVMDDYLWEEVIQQGGYDVVAKPIQDEELIHTLEFAWPATKSRLSGRHTE